MTERRRSHFRSVKDAMVWCLGKLSQSNVVKKIIDNHAKLFYKMKKTSQHARVNEMRIGMFQKLTSSDYICGFCMWIIIMWVLIIWRRKGSSESQGICCPSWECEGTPARRQMYERTCGILQDRVLHLTWRPLSASLINWSPLGYGIENMSISIF